VRDPSQVLIDDVLATYLKEVVLPSGKEKLGESSINRKRHLKLRRGHADPAATADRIKFLRAFWAGHTLDYVCGNTCDGYIEQRSTDAAARRELEDFRAAINHHRKRGLHDRIISVSLPEKGKPRELWFERDQAATAIWAAWRYKDLQTEGEFVGINTATRGDKIWYYAWRGGPRLYAKWGTPEFKVQYEAAIKNRTPIRYTRRHVAHFMVFARWMGSRPSVICSTSIEAERPKGLPWCDLKTGMFYGLPDGEHETKKRRQKAKIPKPLLAHLRRWQKLGHRYVVQFNGAPVLRVTKAHNAAIADAGLPPEYTPHIWRHSVATWLMRVGADPWKVSKFLAMSLETLLRVYGHHRADDTAAIHGSFHAHRRQRTANDWSEQTENMAPRRGPKSTLKSRFAG
jgi:integrase